MENTLHFLIIKMFCDMLCIWMALTEYTDGINRMLFMSNTVNLWIIFSFWVSRLIKSVFFKTYCPFDSSMVFLDVTVLRRMYSLHFIVRIVINYTGMTGYHTILAILYNNTLMF